MIKGRVKYEYQRIHWIWVSALINESNLLLASISTWDLCITRVTVSESLVVMVSNTCIWSLAASNMPLIVLSSGMANLSEVECDWTWSDASATVNIESLKTVFESSASSYLVSALVAEAFRVLRYFFLSLHLLFFSYGFSDSPIFFLLCASWKTLDIFPR